MLLKLNVRKPSNISRETSREREQPTNRAEGREPQTITSLLEKLNSRFDLIDHKFDQMESRNQQIEHTLQELQNSSQQSVSNQPRLEESTSLDTREEDLLLQGEEGENAEYSDASDEDPTHFST